MISIPGSINKTCTFAAVILAAGMSNRMGRPKQLLRLAGMSMLDHAIAAVKGAGIVTPVLVLGAYAPDILRCVKLVEKCEVVLNKDFAEGQATSLRVGVDAVSGKCEAAVFMLADQPLVDAALVAKLMDHFSDKNPDVLYPVYKGQRGNPVIISASLFPRLMSATGDKGARFIFADKSLNILAHEVDDKAVITDVDTWNAYDQVMRIMN